MPRYSLSTLLILLAIGPPLGAGAWLFAIRFGVADKKGAAYAQIALLNDAVELYVLNVGDLPPNLDALVALPPSLPNPQAWSGPYLEGHAIPMDPWSNPFRYQQRPNLIFRVWSSGPDGSPSTNDDITLEHETSTTSL